MAHYYKTVLKKIILKLGFGFKKDRLEACLGEEIPLQIDEELFKDKVSAKPPKKKNSLVRWLKGDASEITDSKTTQDDLGNTETIGTVDGGFKNRIQNLSESDLAQAVLELVTSAKGTPILRLLAEKTQQYQIYLNRTDKSLMISGHNLQDPSQTNNFWQITRRGTVKNLNQPQGLIVLQNPTANVTGNNNWYRLGSTETWTAIFDNYKIFTGLGGSAGNPLKALLNEGGSYQFKIGIALNTPGRATSLQFRILTKGRQYYSFGNVPAGLTDGYLSDNIGVIADRNDELLFEVLAGIVDPRLEVRINARTWPILYTGIFYYLMG